MLLTERNVKESRLQAAGRMCRDTELVQLRDQLDGAGLDAGRTAALEAELSAAMSQVAAKVCTILLSSLAS